MNEKDLVEIKNNDGPRVYIPKPDFAYNPLRDWPRNDNCFCGSLKKFKRCHLDKLEHAVPKAMITHLRLYVKRFVEGQIVEKLNLYPQMLLPEFRHEVEVRAEV